MSHPMGLTFEAIDTHIALLRLTGEVDLACKDTLDDQFQILHERGFSHLIVDASEVTFIDSTGLNCLVQGKLLLGRDGTATLVVVSRPVQRLIELAFPDHFFDASVDTLGEALEMVNGRIAV